MSDYTIPWPEAKSHYDSDGPRNDEQEQPFTAYGATLQATATGDLGTTTMRDRYEVSCHTCNQTIHPSTTSATIRVHEHLAKAHGMPQDTSIPHVEVDTAVVP